MTADQKLSLKQINAGAVLSAARRFFAPVGVNDHAEVLRSFWLFGRRGQMLLERRSMTADCVHLTQLLVRA
jgi:hypothetical protein